MMHPTAKGTALLIGAVAATITACSASTGTTATTTPTTPAEPVIPKAQIEQHTPEQIKAQHPDKPVAVSCPADLPQRNGASEQCLLTSNTEQYPVTVTVSGVGTPNGAGVDWQIGHRIPGT